MAETVHKAPVTRNYFETSHGKGPCDKLGRMIKRKVSNAVLHDNDLSVQQRCISSVSQDWQRLVNHPMCHEKVNMKQVLDHSNWLNKWIVQV